jgi:hypothetical protein
MTNINIISHGDKARLAGVVCASSSRRNFT